MNIDDIKAQLDRIFAAGNRSASREQAAGLRAALVEFKVGMAEMQQALEKTEAALDASRREVIDCQRRGELATEIGDQETARLANEYLAKARERTDVLERKVLAQRDELAIAEREYQTARLQFQNASHGLPLDAPSDSPGVDSGMPLHEQIMQDQRAKEAAVEAQLAHLKKKLGDKR